MGDSCRVLTGSWNWSSDHDRSRVNFPQDDRHPVVCIDWYDALAYVEWLNTRGKHPYYLPSEAEFEYANRAGADGSFPWGGSRDEICRHSNVADARVKAHHAAATGTAAPVVTGEYCQTRVIKGACYESIAKCARAASRGREDIPGMRIAVIGFRVAARLD